MAETPNNRIQRPEDESEAADGSEEFGSLGALRHCSPAASDCQNIHDHDIENATHRIVSPLLDFAVAESGEETGEDHKDISHNGNDDIGAVHTSKESKIKEYEGCCDTPINIASPEDLAVNIELVVLSMDED